MMSTIRSQWNKENDAAVFSPGDQRQSQLKSWKRIKHGNYQSSHPKEEDTIMSIYSLWNPENDEAIFSPGDQKPFSTLIRVDSDKHTHTDKTLEYELHGTVLNEIQSKQEYTEKGWSDCSILSDCRQTR